MLKSTSLSDVMRHYSTSDRGITFISKHEELFIPYGELYSKAQSILYLLQVRGMQPKDELIFQLEDNRSFIYVFWACILGGIIPVPITVGNNAEHKLKLLRIWEVLNRPCIITTQNIAEQIEAFLEQNAMLSELEEIRQNVLRVEEWPETTGKGILYSVQTKDIALIQFSSGSTGNPKGVILTHENVLSNIEAIIIGTETTSSDSSLSWMPLTHDMGLIGFHLAALVAGINQFIMPPALFISNPNLWMQKTHEHRITCLSSPNFGYKHFLNHFKGEVPQDWDLSCARLLFNGAEPISAELSQQFLNVLAPYRLHENVMFPVYGMAEASLAVTFPPVAEPLIPVFVDRNQMSVGQIVQENNRLTDDCVTFVDVGYPVVHCHVRICDDDNRILNEWFVGNIQISGKNVTSGYYNNPTDTAKLITKDGWLITGDLGFIRNNRLVVTGRKKDIIFVYGQNYYPHDLEAVVQKIAGIELGKIAVCGVPNAESGMDEIIAFVLFRGKVDSFVDLAIQLKKGMNRSTGLHLSHVIPVKNIPKTTSGKLQRYKLAESYERGEFINVIQQLNASIDVRSLEQEISIPSNQVEQQLSNLWLEVLKLKQVDMHIDFFELGGDSLKAALLVTRIHKAFNVEIPLTSLYHVSTIKKLADYILHAEANVYNPIPQAEHRDYYPVSSSQYRVYVQEQFTGIGTSYNIPVVLHLQGDFNVPHAESVFQKLIRRHEILRTSFVEIEGEIMQKIHDGDKLTFVHLHTTETKLHEVIQDFIRPFDLRNAPLFRVGFITCVEETLAVARYHLVLDMHHSIADGITIQQLIQEFTALYLGQELAWPTLQYKDFALWQKLRSQSNDMQYKQEYWQRQLSGEIPLLALPTDHKRGDQRTFQGDAVTFQLSQENVMRLRQLAQQHTVTLNTLMTSMYTILLNKYTQQEDIIVGSLSSGRNHADLALMFGMFVNYIPLRFKVQYDHTFLEFLHYNGQMMTEAYEYQDYPYENMVADLSVKTAQGRNPLFDTMLILHNQMDISEMIQMDDLQLSFEEWKTNTAKLDLKLDVYTDHSQGLICKLEYNVNLFKRTTMERFASHFCAIVQAVLENPQVRLGDIEMLSQEEKAQILWQFNDTSCSYPQEKLLHQWFEEQAEQRPEQIALRIGSTQVTYRVLNEKANQLAKILKKNGLGANGIAAILTERTPEMMIGILAILKAGGAYLPITPDYPCDRIGYMLADSGAVFLLVQNRWLHLFDEKESAAHTQRKGEIAAQISDRIVFSGFILDLEDESLYQGDAVNLPQQVTAQDLAYIIYTSGSTGNPKGVMIEHAAVVNRIYWMQKQYPLGPNDVILQKTAFTFDVSVWELFWWSFAGATVSFLEPGGEKEPNLIARAIVEHQITTLHFVPSMLQLFLEYLGTASELSADKLISLRHVFASGEALSVQQVERFYCLFPPASQAKLINLYGPTEAAIDVSYFDCQAEESLSTVPIGKPIDNIQLYVVDVHDHLQPVGLPGELCIAGAGLARGYIHRPELTAEKFVENPFVPGTRMYRTGDLARWQSDGTIEYMGRLDHQIKLRGYRIELGEIEAALLKHEYIAAATVLVKTASDGDSQLSAYIVPMQELTVVEIRKHLSQSLPEYMIPAYYTQLDKMLLTSNGKVDRKALAQLEVNLRVNTEFTGPINEVEAKLVEIWQEVLCLDRVGTLDNFFEIGGHSLKATQLLHKLHQALQVDISLREIFSFPTIHELAASISYKERSVYEPIPPAESRDYFPLSSAQNRLYILHHFEGIGSAYHLPAAMVFEGRVDQVRFEQAFLALINRHESLRTSFELIDGIPMQKIHQQVLFKIDYIAADNTSLSHYIREFIRPFDLSQAPLLRAGIIQLPEDKQMIMFDMHHIISDGVSMGILVQDFVQLYEGRALTDLKLQYKDFSVWQQDFLNSLPLRKQEQYWLNLFADGIPVLNLSTDYSRPSVKSFEGARVAFEFGEDELRDLKKLASETKVTLYMVLLAAFNILLSKYSGQEDIIVGSPVSGRPHADLNNTIGMFVNTVPLRNYPSSNKTFLQFLQELKVNTLLAFENQDYPFEELVGKLQINRDLSRNPVFDVMFVMQNMEIPELIMNDRTMKMVDFEHTSAKFDLTLEVIETDNGIKCHIEYCTFLFKADTIAQLVRHFRATIRSLMEHPQIRLSEVEMLSQEEQNQLLFQFNDKLCDYPRDTTIQQLFEAQVEMTPNHVAVLFEGNQLTYLELNQRANQLARTLRTLGVKADQLVGIITERSLEMIVGILAILKAGGAYVPIDPLYPQERIGFMLEDSGVKLLLLQRHLKESVYFSGELIVLEDANASQADNSNLEPISGPNHLAYVIYTSGSTGKPKGVLIEHKNVVRLLFNSQNLFDFTASDTWTLFHSFCFDFSVWEMYGALLYGGKLVIVPHLTAKNPQQFLELLSSEQITILNQTPTYFYQLLQEDISHSGKKMSLRKVIFGGEALSPYALKDWKANYPDTQLINMYGITETTVHVTYKEITMVEIEQAKSNIGKTIPTLNAYILDAHQHLQPIGTQGELYIAGDGLARGYLNRPDLTAEKFVDNPFVPGERMYRTGDLAQWLPDGNIEYMGRIDDQVKIRGYRIELGEIEKGLLQYKDITESVVLVKESGDGDKLLCAYIVTKRELTVAEIRKHLSQTLPDYMIPAYYTHVEKIPLTSNGKVDRKVLLQLEGRLQTNADYTAPQNDLEGKLEEIWKEVLNLDRVGTNDNFFDIGGHSLLLLRMHAHLEKHFIGQVKVTDLFAYPTIEKLAAFIQSESATSNDDAFIPFIELPENYFSERHDPHSGSTFKFPLDTGTANTLILIGKDLNCGLDTILSSIYLYLFAQVTKRAEHAIQIIMDDQKVRSLDVDLSQIKNVTGLAGLVKQKVQESYEKNNGYFIKDIIKRVFKPPMNSISALFYNRSLLHAQTPLSDTYDLILSYQEENGQIIIYCDYNGRRMQKEKVKAFIQGYGKLAKWYANQYISD